MVCYNPVVLGGVRWGAGWHGRVRAFGPVRHGLERLGGLWYGAACCGEAKCGTVGLGQPIQASVRLGLVRFCGAGFGPKGRYGLVSNGAHCSGMVWQGRARQGMVVWAVTVE
jgi:hypothetical protein